MSAFPFDHLTLAEVAECERLAATIANRRATDVSWRDHVWLAELLARRHQPQYAPRTGCAA